MVLRKCFLCSVVLLLLCTINSRGIEHIKDSHQNTVSLLTEGQEKQNQETDSSGDKKFGQPIGVDDEDNTAAFINEKAPEIKSQDISPEQELQMASIQDSSYQEATDEQANDISLDSLASRTLEQASSTQDLDQLAEDNDSYVSDEKLGNYSQGESDDILQRQFIAPLPVIHPSRPEPVIIRRPAGFIREPHPYPATIHVRLPNHVNVLPRIYNVHHYSPHYYPVHYRKEQSVPLPYYVPMKTGPDVQDTHLHVYHPGR